MEAGIASNRGNAGDRGDAALSGLQSPPTPSQETHSTEHSEEERESGWEGDGIYIVGQRVKIKITSSIYDNPIKNYSRKAIVVV